MNATLPRRPAHTTRGRGSDDYGRAVHPIEQTIIRLARRAAGTRVPWDGLDVVFGEVAEITTCRIIAAHPQHGRRTVPVPDELRAAFVDLRRDTATADRGAWFVASLHISRRLTGETVHETFTYHWDDRPAFLRDTGLAGPLPVPPLPYDTDFVLDLADHPRSRKHTPAWLARAVKRPQSHDDELLEPGRRGEARLLTRQLVMDVVDAHRGIPWSRIEHEFVVLDRSSWSTGEAILRDGTPFRGDPLFARRGHDLVRELRQVMTEPGRGTWLSAFLTVNPDASFDLRFNHDARPYTQLGGDRWTAPERASWAMPGDAAWVADLETHPRDPEHLPPWYAEVVASERRKAELRASTPFDRTRIGAAVARPSAGPPASLLPVADAPAWRTILSYVEPAVLQQLRSGDYALLDDAEHDDLWPRTLDAVTPAVLGDVIDGLGRDGHTSRLLIDAAQTLRERRGGRYGDYSGETETPDPDEPLGYSMSEPGQWLLDDLGDVIAEAIDAELDERFPGVRRTSR